MGHSEDLVDRLAAAATEVKGLLSEVRSEQKELRRLLRDTEDKRASLKRLIDTEIDEASRAALEGAVDNIKDLRKRMDKFHGDMQRRIDHEIRSAGEDLDSLRDMPGGILEQFCSAFLAARKSAGLPSSSFSLPPPAITKHSPGCPDDPANKEV